MFTLDEMRRAQEVVLSALRATPALNWPLLDERLGAEVVVKHENHNPTGAFKVRGGLTYVDALIKREPVTGGLISATRGNHGQKSPPLRGGAPASRSRSSRRKAIRVRRTRPCARSAPN